MTSELKSSIFGIRFHYRAALYVGMVHAKSDVKGQTSFHWFGVNVWKREYRLRYSPSPRHLTPKCISETLPHPTLKDWVRAYPKSISCRLMRNYQVSSKLLQQCQVSCQLAYVFAPSYLRVGMSIYLPLNCFYFAYEEHVHQVSSNCPSRIKFRQSSICGLQLNGFVPP
ncbi:hypothetical protein AVEN_212371-1 [Araneus ventricosus]|uniref:Uncharacterized protein n=1 Tax=Araneus ventricosus TaxID=182803 RepID=A0A4Y2N4F8_ARAVE|nr:hypothetical protein AVEN_212371-1 [Araneus ventricosus]